MLIIRGVNLFHTQVEEVIEKFEQLLPNYQLVVTREGTLDQLTVRVEAKGGVETQNTDVQKELAHAIKNTIGLSAKIILEPIGRIPRSEGGKLTRVIDKRKLYQ